MRTLPILCLALAACSGPPDADEAAAADSASPAAALAAAPSTATSNELPDFGDPRQFLDLESIRWAQWETRRPADPAARLRELGIVPIRTDSVTDADAAGEYDPIGERVQNFHFVDFSGDGVADVIYTGPWYDRVEGRFAAMEGTRLKMWQVIGGRGVQVMAHHGAVQRIWKGPPGTPVSFRAVHYGCCSDPQWTLLYHRPVRAGDTVRFQEHRRVMGRAEMEMPTQFLPAPRRFTVRNDRYLLRDAPRIEAENADGETWHLWEGHGNALAEYASGARGIALAERTDATGRVWWFVRMDGATPPRDAQFEDQEGAPTDRLGWMSSRFLSVEP